MTEIIYDGSIESLQRYFDKTVLHILSLPRQAADPDRDACVYLTDDGLKCAVGVHIPDGHPGQRCRGDLTTLAKSHKLSGIAWPKGNQAIARELQGVHDSGSNWDGAGFRDRYGRLAKLADEYGLDKGVLQEVRS